MASQIFWLAASLNVALVFGFELRVRNARVPISQERRMALERGQHKDNWLLCAVIWIGVANSRLAGHELVMLVGAMLLAWLTRRAVSRLRLLLPKA